ncbi:MFS transporter [Trichocoleus sp. FACHB-591]|uniref:MFS transporter n=1 Tax=Trichocoleus sp. FACHB-591 TaxID=2692872 RepID=UPI001689B71E|nr:MFS transporter [Trichocoleus sp. FACHB-591]
MNSRFPWLPQFNAQVWILVFGRLLSQVGSGFTLFYAPIFFVNQVHLSAAAVGLGLGSASISGVLGRLASGSLSDSPQFGRRRTLLLSALVSAIASFVLAATTNFPIFVIGNLLMGLGLGLYWPATEAVVADLTTPDQRNEAYALTRLADSLGLGLGVILGGVLISATGAYRTLFILDGISFVVFFGVIYAAIAETVKPKNEPQQWLKGWGVALRDRALLVYALVNILFTTYVSQIQSTMPLYFSNFVSVGNSGQGFAPKEISALFTAHLVLSVLCQLPAARWLNRFSRPHALMISALIWAVGFVLVWATGISNSGQWLWAGLSLAVLAIANVAYTPAASSLVVDLAPESLRGVYLSINSQCWAIGYFIGPPLGGWALDQSKFVAYSFWLGLALSIGVALLILQYLQHLIVRSP